MAGVNLCHINFNWNVHTLKLGKLGKLGSYAYMYNTHNYVKLLINSFF